MSKDSKDTAKVLRIIVFGASALMSAGGLALSFLSGKADKIEMQSAVAEEVKKQLGNGSDHHSAS